MNPQDEYDLRRILVQAEVSFGVSGEVLVGPSRKRKFVNLRRGVWWLLRQKGWSLPKIGASFHRDHATIRTAVLTFEQALSRGDLTALSLRAELLDPGTAPPISLGTDTEAQFIELARRLKLAQRETEDLRAEVNIRVSEAAKAIAERDKARAEVDRLRDELAKLQVDALTAAIAVLEAARAR